MWSLNDLGLKHFSPFSEIRNVSQQKVLEFDFFFSKKIEFFRVGTAGKHQCLPYSAVDSSGEEAVYSWCTFALPSFRLVHCPPDL